MRKTVLSIDPGIGNLGYAVLSCEGEDIRLLKKNIIKTEPKRKNGEPVEDCERLFVIYQELSSVFEEFKIDFVVYERIFQGNRTGQTTQAVRIGMVIGIIEVLAYKNDASVHTYTANQVKLKVAGTGKADKNEIKEAVKEHLNHDAIVRNNHVADSIAIGLCHLFSIA